MTRPTAPSPLFESWLRPTEDGVLVEVLAVPRASRDRVLGIHDDRLKIQLNAAPVDGQANDALVRFLARALDIPKARIDIVAGATSRRKTVLLRNMTASQVQLALSPARG